MQTDGRGGDATQNLGSLLYILFQEPCIRVRIADAKSAGYEEVLDRVLHSPSMSFVKVRTTAFVAIMFITRHSGSALQARTL